MIKGIKKWFSDTKNVSQKKAGLKEKEESVRKKLEASLAIINDVKVFPIEIERRHNGLRQLRNG